MVTSHYKIGTRGVHHEILSPQFILKKEDSVRITRMENIGSLDLSNLFNAIYNSHDIVFVIIKGTFKDRKIISEYNSFQKNYNVRSG